MKLKLKFETEISVDTDDLDEAEALAKIEAQGMSNVMWADHNWNRFQYKGMDLEPELSYQQRRLEKLSCEMLDTIKNIPRSAVDDVDMCKGCDGYKESDCCGAPTDTDILICSDCKEHCGVRCDECEYKNL